MNHGWLWWKACAQFGNPVVSIQIRQVSVHNLATLLSLSRSGRSWRTVWQQSSFLPIQAGLNAQFGNKARSFQFRQVVGQNSTF
ncbi:hypothetical protein GE061_005551 [Apolygus lucorum]|uniref:Uncharacterized protein n=1 Tax=Apolygus lucorum TaxID=248454 RepID=A0A8S9WXZ1_APOLU|nr:hypothetical protein GE061_005551 [Apolygus lucorum]